MNNSRIETLAIKYVCGIHNIHTLTQITIHRNTYKESIVFLSFNNTILVTSTDSQKYVQDGGQLC